MKSHKCYICPLVHDSVYKNAWLWIHFDMDPDSQIRIGEKRIRIRLWIRIRPKIEENYDFFSLIKNMILKSQNYDLYLLFISLLSILNIKEKSDLFLK